MARRPAALTDDVRARLGTPAGAGLAAAAAAVGLLAVRLVPDVAGRPLVEDEAVAGLIAARPLGEALGTAVVDRGGAPLHYALAHVVLALEPTPAALRWLSFVCALAAVGVVYDLGRRVAGHAAGAVAAGVAATSTVLGVYGTFGRMYALYVLAAALAADLFVRAVRSPTRGAVFAAAAAAWLLPASHPYGVIPLGAEALVALALWRGRPLSAALPALPAALAVLPLVVADLRLADRFAVGTTGGRSLASPAEALEQTGRALAATAGGRGVALVVLTALGVLGLVRLARVRPAYAALTAVAIAAPPLLLVTVRTGSTPGLSPRHLAFLLPLWACAVGAGASWAVRLPSRWAVPLLAAVVALAALAPPGGIRDPRDRLNVVLGGGPAHAATGGRGAREPAARWLEATVRSGDLLLPYSSVYLAALPETRRATALPYTQPDVLLDTLARAAEPTGAVFVALPLGEAAVRLPGLRAALAPGDEARVLGAWLLLRARGPFSGPPRALGAACRLLGAAAPSLHGAVRIELSWYVGLASKTVASALGRASPCAARVPAAR